jgi:hypothetical protein
MKDNFTLEYYANMLRHALETHQFVFFNTASHDDSNREIILRHDIDLSIHAAHTIATIENELGISSTYFLRLSSTFYNVFSSHEFPKIKEITEMGHHIGLHFDTHFYQSNSIDLFDGIKREMDILAKGFGTEVYAISQHRPFQLGGVNLDKAGDLFKYFAYADMFMKNYKYISDSGQNWREKDLNHNIKQHNNLQVLVHPIWWTEAGKAWQECMIDMSIIAKDTIGNKVDLLIDRYGGYRNSLK